MLRFSFCFLISRGDYVELKPRPAPLRDVTLSTGKSQSRSSEFHFFPYFKFKFSKIFSTNFIYPKNFFFSYMFFSPHYFRFSFKSIRVRETHLKFYPTFFTSRVLLSYIHAYTIIIIIIFLFHKTSLHTQ